MTSSSPVEKKKKLIVFLNYRSLFECEDVDHLNYEAWREILNAFGYGDLKFDRFLSELALKSPSEVLMALCPYTTRNEWGPLLNKRDVRISKEIQQLCFAEVLPIQGIRDFLIDCSRNASQCTTVFLSPFQEDSTRRLLEVAEISPFIDLVHSYTEREYGLIETLEMLGCKPRSIPDDVRHAWEKEEKGSSSCDDGAEPPRSTTPSAPCQQKEHEEDTDATSSMMVTFESDVYGVINAKKYGMKVIGIGCNAVGGIPSLSSSSSSSAAAFANNNSPINSSSTVNQSAVAVAVPLQPQLIHKEGDRCVEEDEYEATTKGSGALLAAGASTVIDDFTSIKYDYLEFL